MDGKTHFADDDTIRYIAKLQRERDIAMDERIAAGKRIEELEKQRDELLEACQTFVEWLDREDAGFVKAGNKRDTPEDEIKWREWFDENLRICALAQEQARAAIAKVTQS